MNKIFNIAIEIEIENSIKKIEKKTRIEIKMQLKTGKFQCKKFFFIEFLIIFFYVFCLTI